MTQDDFQKQVIDRLDKLDTDLDKLDTDLDKLDTDVEKISKDNEKFSDRFANYQQSTQSLVSLAFSLIASATVITVISAVFKR